MEKKETYDWSTPPSCKEEDSKEFDEVRCKAFYANPRPPAFISVMKWMSTGWALNVGDQGRSHLYYYQCYIQLYRPVLRYRKVVLLYKYLSSRMVLLPKDLYPTIARFLIY